MNKKTNVERKYAKNMLYESLIYVLVIKIRAVKWKNNNNKVITYTRFSVVVSEYVVIINTKQKAVFQQQINILINMLLAYFIQSWIRLCHALTSAFLC